jgi:hypothetical protein
MTDSMKDSMTDGDEFARRAGERLRESADTLDGATRSRLNQARQRALAELDSKNSFFGGRQWMPAGAAALIAVIAVSLWQGRTPDEPAASLPLASEVPATIEALDFELLLDESDFEMIENLEFFVWLPDDESEAAG